MSAKSHHFWSAVLAVGFILVTIGGLLVWDAPVADSLRGGAVGPATAVARFLSRYGDFPFLLAGGIVCLAVALRQRRREWARILTAMILSGVLAGLATNVIKLAAGRVRPRAENIEMGWYGPRQGAEWVSLRHEFQAFPSSHASSAFGFFFPLFFSRRLIGSAGLIVSAAVAWSRVQLNAHHVSDVAVGALVGLLAALLVWEWIVRRGGLARWLGPA